jgi:RHS repeat-associated protein
VTKVNSPQPRTTQNLLTRRLALAVVSSLAAGILLPVPAGAAPVEGVDAAGRRVPVVSSPGLVLAEPSVPKPPGVVPPAWDRRMPRVAKRSVGSLPQLGKEVVRRRDAVTEVFANADGTETVKLHAEPVHYQPKGAALWEKIDNTVVADPTRAGWVRNAANDWTVRFGPIAPGGVGGVELVTKAGVARWAPELPVGVTEPVLPTVGKGDKANTVSYRNVWPSVDVVYTVTGSRVKEDIVVRGGARAEFPFVVEGLGLAARDGVAATAPKAAAMPEVTGTQAGVVRFGRLDVTDADGKATRSSGAHARVEPYVQAAGAVRTGPANPGAAKSGAAKPGAQRLVVSVNEAWLATQAGKTGPVVVDPTVVVGPARMCQFPVDESYSSCDGIGTGTFNPNGGHWWVRSVAQWNYRPYVQSNDVLYAGVWLNENALSSPDPELVNIWEATGWSAAGAVANGDPVYWIGDAVVQPDGCGVFGDVCFDVTDTMHSWQLRGVFNGWWDGKFGFSPDEADYPGFLQRYSFKNFDLGTGVALVMNLNARTPTPELVAPKDGALAIDTLTPTLKWSPVTDPDGDPVRYTAKIATGTDGESGLVATSPELTGTEWTVPAGVLKDGLTYYWKVFATDTRSWTPSGVWKLTVDRRLGSGGLSPSDTFSGLSTNLVTGNLSMNVAAPDMPSVGGGVGVDFAYNGRPSLTGLVGTYREDKDRDQVVDPEDPVKLVRTDSQISFNWGEGSPSPAVPTDFFLVNWSGTVRTPAGSWQFGVWSDDGVRVWVDGTKVLDHWGGLTPPDLYQSGSVSGQHRIQVDYFEHSAPAYIELWVRNADNPGQAFIVPADWLSPDSPDLPAGWSLQAADANVDYTRAHVSEGSVALSDVDGSTWAFTKQPDGGYKPPEGVEDVLVVNPDGRVTVHDDAGLSYVFRPDGGLEAITSALDDRRPAAAVNHYDSQGRLDRITDPVSDRSVTLRYAASDGDSSCPNVPPLGSASQFESEEGMLCRVSYWDGTSTELFYFKTTDLLSHIANPGDAWWSFSYDGAGRLVGYADPLARDAAWAAARTDSDGNRWFTQVAYQGTGNATRVQSVTAPAALQSDTQRPQRSYSYTQNTDGGILIDGTATVTRAGAPGPYRTVGYDHRGRTVGDTNAVGQTTKTFWEGHDLQVATETPDGLLTATMYNGRHQPTDVWGPAPKDWFYWVWYGADFAFPKPEYAARIPHSVTRYDEGITGLQVKWWNNVGFDGPPKAHQHDPGELRDWDSSGRPEGLNADGVSARYTGDITFPTPGEYRMQLCSGPVDAAWLYIDGRLVTSVLASPEGLACSDTGALSALVRTYGPNEVHRVQVDYKDFSHSDLLHLNWVRPDGAYVPVPTLTAGYGLATSTVDPDGKATRTEYTDPAAGIGPQHGLVTRTTVDPGGLNLTETTTYEPAGGTDRYLRPLTRTLPAGPATTTSKGYYGNTEQRDNPCTTASDPANQGGMQKLDTAADPDGPGSQSALVRESIYDSSGRTVASRVGTEPWTCTRYDGRGRTIEVKYPAFGGQPARTVTSNYAADPDGAGPRTASPLVTAVTDPAGSIISEVDLLGRVISYRDVFGNTTTFTYDLAGRETANAGPVGAITKTYDNADRLTSLSRNGAVLAEAFVYDAASRLKSVTYPSGAGKAGNGTTGTFIYEPIYGRLTKVTWTGPGGALITSDEVTRRLGSDVIGQVTDGVDHHPGDDYVYDNAGRLTEAWSPARHTSYRFDPTGGCGALTTAGANTNRTRQIIEGGATTSYCYDNADRLTSTTEAGVGAIAYDAHGNTTNIFGETHGYDAADRHMTTTKAGTTVSYVRDATDRIVERKVGGITAARYGSTGSGDAPEFTTNAADQVQEVTYSLPGGVLLTTRAAGNVWSYPNTHGGIVATANQAGAKQGATRVYDPYGNILGGAQVPDNSAGSFDYGWLGQHQRPLEHEPGLQPIVEMGARQYSPLLSRFLEVDPIEGGSANDYDYVNGDPTNNLDLAGTCKKRRGVWGALRGAACHAGNVVTKNRVAKGAGRAARATAGWAGRNFSAHGLNNTRNSVWHGLIRNKWTGGYLRAKAQAWKSATKWAIGGCLAGGGAALVTGAGVPAACAAGAVGGFTAGYVRGEIDYFWK